jgi:hypothetical protein
MLGCLWSDRQGQGRGEVATAEASVRVLDSLFIKVFPGQEVKPYAAPFTISRGPGLTRDSAASPASDDNNRPCLPDG